MSKRKIWTAREDEIIRQMIGDGLSLDAVAERIGVSRWTASRRAAAIGAKTIVQTGGVGAVAAAHAAQRSVLPPDRGIDPLPPGHPLSWRDALGMDAPYPYTTMRVPV